MKDVPGGTVSSRPTSLHGRRHEHQGSVPGCSVCTETPSARCSRTRYRRDTEDDNLPEDPGIGPYTGVIDRILEDDPVSRTGQALGLPRKQRHTAKRIYERLRDEYGFDGRYTIVKDYVREHRRRTREMFVPLVHPPGHAQCDFGEALAVIGGVSGRACPGGSRGPLLRPGPAPQRCHVCQGIPRRDHRGVLRRDMCRRSRSLRRFHRASCTTTPVWPLPGYWETVVADAHECSQSFSRTTCRGQVRTSGQGQRQGEGRGYGRIHQEELPGAHTLVR